MTQISQAQIFDLPASEQRPHRLPMPLKVAAAILAASVAALSAPPPAFAQVVNAPEATIAVSHGDLNLGSATGRRAIESRIRNAARQLCEPDLVGSLGEWTRRRACYDAAVAGANAQLERALASRDGGRSITVAAR
jgi:UrcA family protein